MSRVLKGPELKGVIQNQCLGEFLFENASKFADKVCQVDANSGRSETYASEKLRSTKLALHLLTTLKPGDVVVFCTRTSFDSITPVLSSLYLGAKVASLHPDLGQRDIDHLLGITSPKLIFVDEEAVTLIENGLRMNSGSEIIVIGRCDKKYDTLDDILSMDFKEEDIEKFRPRRVDPRGTAFILFSSGTTAAPKGICQSHRSLLQISSQLRQFGRDFSSILLLTTLYWISGIFLLLSVYPVGGCRIYLPKLDPDLVLRTIDKYKITYMLCCPGFIHNIIQGRDPSRYPTKSLKALTLGGTTVTPCHFKQIQEFFRDTIVASSYGTTETGYISGYDFASNIPYKYQNRYDNIISAGRVAPGVTVKIVDQSTNFLVAPDQLGEILVRATQTTMIGYHTRDNVNEAFDAEGFFKTGDLGFYDDEGCLYIVDRIKELFIYKGFQVVPSRLEEVLSQHPDVEGSVAFGIPREEEEGCLPAAWVVPRSGCRGEPRRVVANRIEEFVNGRVAEYEKLRGGVRIVDEIPVTPSGKPARFLIRTQATREYCANDFNNL